MASDPNADHDDRIPDHLVCPITRELIQHPVVLLETGQTYERDALAIWFATGRRIDPATGAQVRSTNTRPNVAIRKALADFVENKPQWRRDEQEKRDYQFAVELKLREMAGKMEGKMGAVPASESDAECNEVATFLRSLNYGQYIQVVVGQRITSIEMLGKLRRNDWIEMGIEIGPRTDIQNAARARSAKSAPPAPKKQVVDSGRVLVVRAEYLSLRTANMSLQDQVARLTRRLSEAEATSSAAAESIAELADVRQRLRLASEAAHSFKLDLVVARQEVQEKEARVSAFHRAAQEADQSLREARGRISELEEELDSARETVAALEDQLATARNMPPGQGSEPGSAPVERFAPQDEGFWVPPNSPQPVPTQPVPQEIYVYWEEKSLIYTFQPDTRCGRFWWQKQDEPDKTIEWDWDHGHWTMDRNTQSRGGFTVGDTVLPPEGGARWVRTADGEVEPRVRLEYGPPAKPLDQRKSLAAPAPANPYKGCYPY